MRRQVLIIGSLATALALVAALQWANGRQVRDKLCGPEHARCAGAGPMAFEMNQALPALPTGGPAAVLHLRGDTALLRRSCEGAWTVAFGARLDLDPLTLGDTLTVAGGCANLGRQGSNASLQGVQLRQAGCTLQLDLLTAAWHETLDLEAAARIAPDSAAACAAALGDRLAAVPLGPPSAWRLSLSARYGLPYGSVPTAPGAAASAAPTNGLRQAVEAVAMSHEIGFAAEAGRMTLKLSSNPAASAPSASPAVALQLAAEGSLREQLPPDLRALLADAKGLSLRWNLDHESGVVQVQDQASPRQSAPPRPAGPVPLSSECPDDRSTVPLHFVEAGERGEAVTAGQLQAAFNAVDAAQARAGALVSVFVHGWQHSAAKGDSYVCDFAALLSAVDTMEQHAARASGRPARQVLGIYLGWPGRLYGSDLANLTTFWNRLDAADRLGVEGGALRTLLQGLAERITQVPRDPRPDRRSGLVVTGHSMGGRAVFQAVKGAVDAPAGASAPAAPVPDLLLLVNPAFSADQFRAMHARMAQCQPEPLPMLLFSSEADVVTRQVYPAGQAVTFDAARQRHIPFLEHAYTAANFEAYVTHRLGLELLNGPAPQPGDPASILRGFERVPAGSSELFQESPVTVYHQPQQGRPKPSDAWYRMRLVPEPGAAQACATERSRVIKVDARILPDHGKIFTPAFMEFVIRSFNHGRPAPR